MKCKNCKNITFLQLYEKTGIHFTVTGSDVFNYKSVNFNHESFPNMKLINFKLIYFIKNQLLIQK